MLRADARSPLVTGQCGAGGDRLALGTVRSLNGSTVAVTAGESFWACSCEAP